MGTLFSQPERNYFRADMGDLDAYLQELISISSKYGISLTDVIAAARLLELKRRNDLYAANGDVLDEQLAGFGELIEKVVAAIEQLRS